MSTIFVGLGFIVACFCCGCAGWLIRDGQAEGECVDRCLDCDALKSRGGLVVVHGKRPGRAVEAREKGLLT